MSAQQHAAGLLARLRDLEHARLVRNLDRSGEVAALQAEAVAAGEPALAARAELSRAELALARGDAETAEPVVARAVAAAERHGDDELLARTHHARCTLHLQAGDTASALRHAVRALELTGDDSPPWLRAVHHTALSAVLTENTPSFDRAVADALAIAEEVDDPHLAVLPLNNLCWGHALARRTEEARHAAQRLRAVSARTGSPLPRYAFDTMACAELWAGDPEAAWSLVEEGLAPDVPDTECRSETSLRTTAVRVLTALGRTEEACEHLELARASGTQRRLPGMLLGVEEAAAEFHAATGDWRAAYEAHVRFHAEHVEQQQRQDALRAVLALARFDAARSQQERDRYRALAYTDALTGLPNRRAVVDHVRSELPSTERVAVAIVDVDHFKRVNDEHSHDVGDAVLVRLGQLLAVHAAATPGTFVARLGGEEFVVVWTGWTGTAARTSCESLRGVVAAVDWVSATGSHPLTVSIGLADHEGPGASWPDLLARADARLYEAKRAGRDRVIGPSADAARPAQRARVR